MTPEVRGDYSQLHNCTALGWNVVDAGQYWGHWLSISVNVLLTPTVSQCQESQTTSRAGALPYVRRCDNRAFVKSGRCLQPLHSPVNARLTYVLVHLRLVSSFHWCRMKLSVIAKVFFPPLCLLRLCAPHSAALFQIMELSSWNMDAVPKLKKLCPVVHNFIKNERFVLDINFSVVVYYFYFKLSALMILEFFCMFC